MSRRDELFTTRIAGAPEAPGSPIPPAPASPSARDAKLAEIARVHLDVETLATRSSDRLDFHDLAVWSIRQALEAAYDAGLAAGQKKKGARR